MDKSLSMEERRNRYTFSREDKKAKRGVQEKRNKYRDEDRRKQNKDRGKVA